MIKDIHEQLDQKQSRTKFVEEKLDRDLIDFLERDHQAVEQWRQLEEKDRTIEEQERRIAQLIQQWPMTAERPQAELLFPTLLPQPPPAVPIVRDNKVVIVKAT